MLTAPHFDREWADRACNQRAAEAKEKAEHLAAKKNRADVKKQRKLARRVKRKSSDASASALAAAEVNKATLLCL
jgi:hypothetical protein